MDPRHHWEEVYGKKGPAEVSWFQPHAALSFELILATLADRDGRILDVGGGASTLVDDLLDEGYRAVTVLDVARTALARARLRLGARARSASWIVGDALDIPLSGGSVSLWHDRAVFHFLTTAGDRARYVAEVERVIRPGGLVLVATFAADGPTSCSGLPVARYDPAELHAVFDGGFTLLASRRELHRTPSGAEQPFTYCLCRYEPTGRPTAAA
jgi:ubiquinone/menaquinone biosynthesis C-methylase UbiE